MATEIITNPYIDEGYCLTSQLREVAATTDRDYVTCLIEFCGYSNEVKERIYWSVLYASGGRVEISDVGQLVESYYRSNGIIAGNVKIKFDDTFTIVYVLYCETVKPAGWDMNEQMWITSHVQRVHYDSIVKLAANFNPWGDGILRIMGHRRSDGGIGIVEYPLQTPFVQETYQIDIRHKVDWALGKLDDVPEYPLDDVAMLSFEFGGLQVLLYLMRDTEYLTFEFANVFNAMERVDICGTVKVKTGVERNKAVSGGALLQYDRKVTRSYEVETEALSDDDAKMVERLITTHSAAVLIDGELRKIIITDETCESSNDDESLTTYKFTWQFADRRMSDWDAAMPIHDGIFTQEYTEEYE